jgi:glycosyltransferase involved in cell wall biosynthesis
MESSASDHVANPASAGQSSPGRRPVDRAGVSASRRAAPVAAIVLAFNEERNLPDCLESLADWVDELYVVDSGSTDRTAVIARSYGARVFEHPFEHYGAQRNWALDALPLTSPWVLNVDADERVTPELRDSIVAAVAEDPSDVTGFMMSRRTVFMGRWIRHGGHYPAWHLRLFRRGRGRCEDRLYDQHFYCDGPTRKLRGDLIDENLKGIDEWFERQGRYARKEAEHELAEEGRVRFRWADLTARDPLVRRAAVKRLAWRAPGRPLLYFFYGYVVRRGFLDGRDGLVFSLMKAVYQAMIVIKKYDAKRTRAA